ncbi:MAG: AarF/ABC1/UbiB kinase family protein [Chloroflexi bacterium]|nr:AarF/ABC1/UbiB kinase family protein [Chloroflexota bacterium]
MAVSQQDEQQEQVYGRVYPLDSGHSHPDPPTQLPIQYAHFQVHGRYQRIVFFFGVIIGQIILWDLLLARLPLLGDWIRSRRPVRLRNASRRFRALALEMGGVMIKLGQFLSTRVDVLPEEITEELRGLQDEVPPEPTWRMLGILQQEIPDYEDRFVHIEEIPMAAASLGQVHRAWLEGGDGRHTPVVIKIQRPNIERIVQTDLDALQVVARIIMRYKPIGRRADLPTLMEEFAHTLWEELDYELEADHAERFAEMYAESEQVYIPTVYRQHSTKRVIVLENVEGIRITDLEGMKAVGIDPKEVAGALLDTYFQQIFEEAFFHADPHPGNLFVRPREDIPWVYSMNGNQPRLGRPYWLIFVDFGMVGRVPDLVGENLRKMLVSVLQRDGRELTEAYANLGFFLPDADLERIAEAQTSILNRIWGRSLLELARPDPAEVQEIGEEFRDLLFEFPIQVPQDFIYLGRALGMVSGLISLLDEEINPWYYFEKYGETLVQSGEAQKLTLETAWGMIRPYLETPGQVKKLLDMAERGQIRTQSDREILKRYDKIERRLGQLGWSIVSAAGILSAALIFISRRGRKDNQNK